MGGKGALNAVEGSREPRRDAEERVPHSIEAEQALVGALLLDNSVYPAVAQVVDRVDFYYSQHGEIYAALCELIGKGLPADPITVTDHLRRAGRLEFVGGATNIVYCANSVATAALAEHYARIVKENSLLRQVYFLARRVQAAVSSGDSSVKDVDRFLRSTAEAFTDIALGLSGQSGVSRLDETLARDAGGIITRREGLRGITTGFRRLDEITAGMQAGHLIVLGGRPSMGKSTLGLNMAVNAAMAGAKALYVSLEMKRQALVEKVLVALGQANAENVRVGRMTDDDLVGLALGAAQAEKLGLFICDQFELTPLGIRAKAQWLRARHGLDMIVVDYLQLLLPDHPSGNRVVDMSEISRQLKLMAGALNVPVLALSQLSREVEKRADRRPVMADLRDSGSIEQDADVVLLLYRPDYYSGPAARDGDDAGGGNDDVDAEVIVAKQRDGKLGTVRMRFNRAHVRFEDPAE